jgi:glycosyltransferase involved in cell wall biosynthesis
MTVSVILPCYNEKRRILPIIKELKKSKLVSEIIVVDDGSEVETKNILKKINGITLITHPKNAGKSQAMKTGLLHSKGDIIAYLDSDLQHFTSMHIDDLVKPIINNDCDLTLSDRTKDLYILRGFSAAFTGERAAKRELFTKNLSIFKAKGFLIEASMNKKFFKNKKIKIQRVTFRNVCSYLKVKKLGIKGQIQDINMFSDMVKYLGIKEMAHQVYTAMMLPFAK